MTAPAELSLSEIAERVSRHLRRFAAAEKKAKDAATLAERVRWRSRFLTVFDGPAHAHVTGNRLRCVYASNSTENLDRREALAYLAALDDGFEGKAHEWLRENPLPEEERAVLMRVLVRASFGWTLYAVHRMTPKRMYGEREKGAWAGSYVDRDAVFVRNATEETYDRAVAIEREYDEAVDRARRRKKEALAGLRALGSSEP